MITNPQEWQDWQDKNKDTYGKRCVDVARRVMELLDEHQAPLTRGIIYDLISQADREVGACGITRAMAGYVISMVVNCHSRGGEFKESWGD